MKQFRKVTAMLLCMLIALSACLTASADNAALKTSELCSITVNVYQSKEGTTANDKDDSTLDAGTGVTKEDAQYFTDLGYVPLKDVTYKVYKQDNLNNAVATLKTDENGNATTGKVLEQGTYVVKLEETPKSFTGALENQFTVKLPMTNADENGFIYDVVVYPKVDTLYGNVTITKVDSTDLTKKLGGAVFQLLDESKNPYEHNGQSQWTTSEVTGDGYGTFTIVNLPGGIYYLKEIKAPAGYQLDSTEHPFKVERNETYANGSYTISVNNIVNTLAEAGTKTVSDTKVAVGDEITYTINLPLDLDYANAESFVVTDTLNDAFSTTANDVTFTATVATLTKDTNYTITVTDKTVKVEFNESAMTELDKATELTITIKATVSSMTEELLTGIGNTANLKLDDYTTTIKTNDDHTVRTGSTKFKKTDGTNGLAGAKFRVYSDPDCTQEVEFYTSANAATAETEITTTNSGVFTIYGLEPGKTYYLVETKAPDGYELKGTKIQFQPTVGEDTTVDAGHEIVNMAKVTLPFTGGVGAEVVVASGVLMMVAAGFVLKKRVK